MGNLIKVCEDGNLEKVKSIINSGVDINKKYEDRKNVTALIVASNNGNLDIVKDLNINIPKGKTQDNDGWGALMWALDNEHFKVAEYLLEKGADINAKNINGATALIIASSYWTF